MPHCSLEFSRMGLPVAVHSRWNTTQTYCALHLFANHQQVQAFLPKLPAVEAQDFARSMIRCALPANTEDGGMYRIEGVAALSLTNFLVHLRTQVQEIVRVIEAPDLMGFWEPPAWRAPGAGIILWFHPNDGYRAIIAHTKNQATEVIERLSWLELQRRESLCAKIKRWNAPKKSPHTAEQIQGVCAQVLCHASLAAKARNAMHAVSAQAKADLN
ncbi:MAG: hypothetical protein WAP52_01050 [Candidatus Sungiibacteriota bacterium]